MVIDALGRMGFQTARKSKVKVSDGAAQNFRHKAWSETMLHWRSSDLHELVAHFVRIRFPVIVALNKIDLSTVGPDGRADPSCVVARNVRRIKESLPNEMIQCVCAATEWAIVKLRRKTGVGLDEDCEHELPPHPRSEQLEKDLVRVSPFCRGTGVLDCVNRAVACKLPILVYPVSDINTLAAVGGGKRLEVCICMRWGSTVEDLWKYLTRQQSLPHMRGDFVRASARGYSPSSGISRKVNVKKTDLLSNKNCIIQIIVSVEYLR